MPMKCMPHMPIPPMDTAAISTKPRTFTPSWTLARIRAAATNATYEPKNAIRNDRATTWGCSESGTMSPGFTTAPLPDAPLASRQSISCAVSNTRADLWITTSKSAIFCFEMFI
ncbi:Uncharacterised protein [Bordetella pertussis]|nr:Uncharacterised protein [Bordetella pertussis]CFW06745.1 Uncharacterised protein [Bordetella pertussis]